MAKNSSSSSSAATRTQPKARSSMDERRFETRIRTVNHHRYNNNNNKNNKNNIKNAASTKSEPTTGAQNYTTFTTKQKKNEKAGKKCVVGNVPEYICRSSSFSSGVATKECDDATNALVVAGRNEKTRSESDLLGELDTIPKSALYGIATQRAVDYYAITGVKLSLFPEFIRALAFV